MYVNTNFDIFSNKVENVDLGNAYKLGLLSQDGKAYSSPLLFATLTSLLNHGTMMITGAPGIGKTTGAEYAGHFFTGTPLDDILASEIQGHPQLTEEKMVASFDIGKLVNSGERKVLPSKFLECPVKIIDEVNRVPPDVLSIIMRIVDTGHAVYGGEVLKAREGPLFVTANYTDEGTFNLTPPFLDRFDVAVMVTSPQPWDIEKIRSRGDEKLNGSLDELLKIPDGLKLDFEKIRKEIRDTKEEETEGVNGVTSFADFVYAGLRFSEGASDNIVRSTKGNAWQVSQDNMPAGRFRDDAFTYTLNELSVRSCKAMERYAKAYAWLNGREKATVDDLKTILPYTLWHKIQPTSKALKENPKYSNDRIGFVEKLVEKIEGEYSHAIGSDYLRAYAATLDVLRTGNIHDKKASDEEVRNLVRQAINKLGSFDRPYALTLASHIASVYNKRLMKNDE